MTPWPRAMPRGELATGHLAQLGGGGRAHRPQGREPLGPVVAGIHKLAGVPPSRGPVRPPTDTLGTSTDRRPRPIPQPARHEGAEEALAAALLKALPGTDESSMARWCPS